GQPPPEGGAVDVEGGEPADGPADRLGAPAVLGSVGRQRHRRQRLVEGGETGRGRLADVPRREVAGPPVAGGGGRDAGRRRRRGQPRSSGSPPHPPVGRSRGIPKTST